MAEFEHSQRRAAIQTALADFQNRSLEDAAIRFLAELGYQSDHTADFGHTADEFLANIPNANGFNRDKAQVARWRRCTFLFQITGEDIPSLAERQRTFLLSPRPVGEGPGVRAADSPRPVGEGPGVRAADSPRPVGEGPGVRVDDIQSFVFLAIELQDEDWSRTALAGITRELNRLFPMPVIVLFKHGRRVSLAVIDRRTHLRDPSRDVIDNRITVVKDIHCAEPHRAHLDILVDLAIENLGERRRPSTFRELYDAWIAVLSIQALNKDFYTRLAHWYFWAVKQVQFPKGGGADAGKRHAVAVIRLLTRLIFVWFIKEKGLIPPDLFDRARLRELLKTDPTANPEAGNYYLAILQNLFFATLNVEMGTDEQGNRRRWAGENKSGGPSGHYLIPSVYRHKELFKDTDAVLALFSTIPFLNGGLFECLDRELTEQDFQRNPELKPLAVKEGSGWVLRVDGFSRRKEAQAVVPNKLFFGSATADLNADLGTKGKHYEVRGLIDLFDRYKFTVDENTPVEEEVALDPELLGKVFENLLASYNEDTQTTARKQSGSFYTPREVVDYMVDEALIAHFERHLLSAFPPMVENPGWVARKGRPINEVLELGAAPDELDLSRSEPDGKATGQAGDAAAARESLLVVRLRRLLSYSEPGHDFGEPEKKVLIAAIESLKVLDPACGSGAFPMGVLHKLVHVLKKLDPNNILWRQQNRAPLAAQLAEAHKIPDLALREEKVEAAEAALEKFDRDFSSANHADYTRKLYLIEKCIHGVDIQPIAVQIAKLRFFIALIVSQKVDAAQTNHNVTALPNLETKIVAADSLTPIDRPVQGGLRDPAIDEKQKALIAANESYFAARTGKTKRKWRDRIFDLRDELARLLEQDRFLPKGAAKQLVHWNPFDQNSAADFFDPEWMFQLADGFDVVIGNPPYVNAGTIRNIKPRLRLVFGNFFDGNADLFTYFYKRGFDLLRPCGTLAYISSNKFMRTGYGSKTRNLLAKEGQLRSIIDFGELPVFGASVDSAIVVVQRPHKTPNPQLTLRAVAIKTAAEIPLAGQVLAQRGESYRPQDLSNDGWLFEPSQVHNLLGRIKKSGKRLDDIVQGRFYYGIKTGLNDAFVIDGITKNRLIDEDSKSAEVIKPFLNGREILRWHCEFSDQWLLYIPWHFPLHHDLSLSGASVQAEKALKTQYPAIYKHLIEYKDRLLRRNQDETGIRYEWYALQRWGAEYWTEFDKRKLVFNETSKELHAFIDDKSLYINKTGFMILHQEIDYLLGVMNSWILDYYYRHNFPCWGDPWNGGRVQFRKDRMVDAPIPWPDKELRDVVADCVKVVGTIYKISAGAVFGTAASSFEQLINGLVYELFFPDDLHQANIHLFDAAAKAGLDRLATLNGSALANAAHEIATVIFAPNHPIQEMLADLQRLEVVRVIEGRD
ncbi:MAG: TaqI-like C-terminal specificity domain-containing protein [Candidatus Contendobacter sp.]|nr:TaqI-like C-terminal specificity domain-containing protein [Candidatus Contendobacter sp.]